jgi:outer membrane scaffolding protein for murein synthesis (MipA/OmpV family)
LRAWWVVLLLGAPLAVRAEEKPLWEAGIGVFPIWSPDYRGSDQGRGYFLPLPYMIYRGEVLKVDREGINGRLFESDRMKLDLSGDAGVPVDSSKNDARQGMSDLDPVVEVGPSLEICLWRSCGGDRKLQFRLPVRAVFATDFTYVDSIGGTVYPNLNIDFKNVGPGGGWDFGMATGPLFATSRYHNYYYQVAPPFATATRPAYEASSGYSGWRFALAFSKRFENIWFGAFVRLDELSGTVFEDSPLVRTKHWFMTGFGVAWVLGESDERVTVRD